MTETNQTEVTEVTPLVVGNMYKHGNRVLIAISATTMTPLMSNDYDVAADETTELTAVVGNPEWCSRMAGARDYLVAENQRNRDNRADLENYVTNLKEALLEKAIEKDFCREYDDFAAEWDLLPRSREYQVVVRINVMAADEDNAQEIVENAMNLYYVDTTSDPTVEAWEVN